MATIDLTTRAARKEVEDGITIGEQPYGMYLKLNIRLSLFEIGYEWLVEDNSCGGLLQTINMKNPEFKEGDDEGTDTFKLIGFGYGSCTYRMVYAKKVIGKSFAEHKKKSYSFIEFPINFE